MSQPPALRPPVLSRLSRRARLAASLQLMRLANACSRNVARLAELTTSFAAHAIAREDRSALTTAMYSRTPVNGRSTLFAWEESWLARDLPAAPARVLLGGAGQGREARWLVAHGYSVLAFDPVPSSVAQHNAACPEAPSIVLDYESLARASYVRRTGSSIRLAHDAAPVLDRAPYDAALLGWTSLTHVLEEHDQDALFETLAELVPSGPILASFFMDSAGAGAPLSAPSGRAHRLGAALGAAISGASLDAAIDSRRVLCFPHIGFVYAFDRDRLEQLARSAGRGLELYADNTYPHATFR